MSEHNWAMLFTTLMLVSLLIGAPPALALALVGPDRARKGAVAATVICALLFAVGLTGMIFLIHFGR